MKLIAHKPKTSHLCALYQTALFIVSSFLLFACSTIAEANVPSTMVSLPSNHSPIVNVVVLPTGKLIFQDNQHRIWYRDVSGNWRQRSVDKSPPCQSNVFALSTVLPDGRLGMLCPVRLDDNARVREAMIAFDWETSKSEQLVADVLPDPSGEFAWNHDMSKGIYSTSGAYSTLYWLTRAGAQPVEITLSEGSKSWRLPDSIEALDRYSKNKGHTKQEPDSVGMVGAVSWSQVGDQIAFWATLDTVSRPYSLFRKMPWDLYLMDASTLQVRRVLTSVYDAGDLQWSPDGKWLAYTSGERGLQPHGVWLFSPRRGQPLLLRQGHYNSIAWAPDGNSLFAVRYRDDASRETELWNYDISTLIRDDK
jgi:hypothetical protein